MERSFAEPDIDQGWWQHPQVGLNEVLTNLSSLLDI